MSSTHEDGIIALCVGSLTLASGSSHQPTLPQFCAGEFGGKSHTHANSLNQNLQRPTTHSDNNHRAIKRVREDSKDVSDPMDDNLSSTYRQTMTNRTWKQHAHLSKDHAFCNLVVRRI